MALVLIASILLAEFCSVLNVAVIHLQDFVLIFSFFLCWNPTIVIITIRVTCCCLLSYENID